ncbi:3-hydroxyacyl-ACP dehydratase FabZ family protein [Paenibacillus sp. An7]|uniref:3-hydroxyacyl-ACP dehydratase FabZ family protein n=1 Tax=Paenibacillus sp. An7 TaxID=2689577 RepID=UPI001359EA15|nr:3-hydroxyacyl-ACP dehydratase FabZ family protein [Paenibacillus sp. An7]
MDISSTIPHRYPFLFIDKVLEVEKNKWAKGYKLISRNEWFFYEEDASVPNTLIVEALAQLGAFATSSTDNGLGFLSMLKGVEVVGQAYPGDQIELYYEIIKNKRGFVIGKGIASVNERVILKADEIMIYIQPN